MFEYPKDYLDAKQQLKTAMDALSKQGYHIEHSAHIIQDPLAIDKYTIRKQAKVEHRIVLSLGLHGIEGYVGHSALMTFLDSCLPLLKESCEVIVYHPLNPYGMYHYRRTNEHNVDLNRNFSQNNFANQNDGYEKASFFFQPNTYRSRFHANVSYYSNIVKLIVKYGVATMKDATLKGQQTQPEGLYYNGGETQASTSYVISELPSVLQGVNQMVWLDLHTGYGPRYQMSIVNSIHETEDTKDLVEKLDYPLILGLNKDDFYEIDGDMIEYIYVVNQQQEQPVKLYATCFEFGTLGDSLRKTIESLKAMLFENSCHFQSQSQSFKQYANHLIKEQFLPESPKWRQKAYQDFLQATLGILSYKQLIKE